MLSTAARLPDLTSHLSASVLVLYIYRAARTKILRQGRSLQQVLKPLRRTERFSNAPVELLTRAPIACIRTPNLEQLGNEDLVKMP